MMSRKFKLFVATLISLLLVTAQASAQHQRKRAVQSKKSADSKPPLTVVNNPAPAFLSGEVNVNVRGDENPIIRLQMVPNGQALVEFPAKDRIFKVNPADPDLVTIEDSPTKETDRYILLRSNKQFLPNAPDSPAPLAATSLLVQMTSGMVITLLIYPVRDLDHVVHRCVVRYDRDSVVRARQAAGLAVNLDERDELVTSKATTSIRIAPPPKPMLEHHVPSVSQSTTMAGASNASAASTTDEKSDAQESDEKPPVTTPKRIIQATEIKVSKKDREKPVLWDGKLKWSDPLHGLKAAAQTRAMNADQMQVLLTVKNTLSKPIKIAPGQPELIIQTLDERERVLQAEPVKPLKFEWSDLDGWIAAGGTSFYLITFEAPVLGAKQRLCVAVSQINAADEPVMIELTKGTR